MTPVGASPERRVALVTGSTSGIGAEIARRLHADGFAVVVTGRNRQRGEALAARLGAPSTFLPADLALAGAADQLAEDVLRRYGRLDVVVNNAAIDHTADLLTVPLDDIRTVFETNTFAAIAMLQAGARRMRGGGAIINVTSRLASIGVPTMAIYSAAKGALKALTTAAAVELAPRHIRVNAVAPGMTRTPLYDSWLSEQPDPSATEAKVVADIPLGRIAEASDVAAAVSYLASEGAAYVTGATIPVDGGYTAR